MPTFEWSLFWTEFGVWMTGALVTGLVWSLYQMHRITVRQALLEQRQEFEEKENEESHARLIKGIDGLRSESSQQHAALSEQLDRAISESRTERNRLFEGMDNLNRDVATVKGWIEGRKSKQE